jgi:hypothetical protein
MGLVVILEGFDAACRKPAIDNRGLAEEPCLPCNVDVLDVGETAWEASDSTSSIEWLCQPLFTLTMA